MRLLPGKDAADFIGPHAGARAGLAAVDPAAGDGAAAGATPAAPGFTFDDAVLSSSDAKAAAAEPLRLNEPDDGPATAEGASRPQGARSARPQPLNPASPAVKPAELQTDHTVSSRGLSMALGFFGAAMLLIGLLFFGLQRENLGPDPLAQWRSAPPSAPVSAPAPGAGAPDAHVLAAATAPAKSGVRQIKVPAVPGPLPSRPTTLLPVEPAPSTAATPAFAVGAAPAQPGVAAADTAPEQGESDEETLYSLAEEYRQLGDAERSEQLLRRLFREGRQPGRAALALGDLYLARERFEEAREMFDLSKELYGEAKPARAARD